VRSFNTGGNAISDVAGILPQLRFGSGKDPCTFGTVLSSL